MTKVYRPLILLLAQRPDSNLTGAAESIEKIRQALLQSGIGLQENITMVVDSQDRILLSQQFEKLFSEAKEKGVEVLVYYIGHGAVSPTSGDSISGFNMGSGEKSFYWSDFVDRIGRDINLPHVTTIVDCCFAGELIDEVEDKKISHKITVIASSGVNEKSFQDPIKLITRFSNAFADAILEFSESNDKTGVATITKIFERAMEMTAGVAANQNPLKLIAETRASSPFVVTIAQLQEEANFSRSFPLRFKREIELNGKLNILLDANILWKKFHKEDVNDALFELSSGKYAQKFLTIWEVFDDRGLLKDCIRWLTEEIKNLHESSPISCIVTCTDTARELGMHVRTSLRSIGIDLPVCHLGYPPSIKTLSTRDLWLISNKSLILTDVVASGNLVRSIVRALDNKRGNIRGIVAVALTNESLIADVQNSGTISDLGIDPLPDVKFLVDIPIEIYGPGSTGAHERIIEIDHNIVLPRLPAYPETSYKPLIETSKMFKLFDQSGAISAGFFLIEGEPVHSLVDINKLLKSLGPTLIWESIVKSFECETTEYFSDVSNMVIVSTFKEGDVHFRDIIHDQLGANQEIPSISCLTIKRRTKDDRVIFESDTPSSIEIEGKDLWIVFGTSSSTEKIRSVVGFLSTKNPRAVRIVALVSRTGVWSSELLTKISSIASTSEKLGRTQFSFRSVFSLADVEAARTFSALEKVERFFEEFSEKSALPAFRRLATEILNEYTFDSAEVSLEVNGGWKTADPGRIYEWLDTTIAEAVHSYSAKGEIKPLINVLKTNRKAKFFRVLVMIFLGDMSRLEISGQMGVVFEVICRRISEIRESRFEIESEFPEHGSQEWKDGRIEISSLIEIEHSLIESYVILRRFAVCESAEIELSELLMCGKPVDDWQDYPLNRSFFYGEAKTYFYVLILNFSLDDSVGVRDLPQHREKIRGFLEALLAQSRMKIPEGQQPLRSKGALPEWLIDSALDELAERGSESFFDLSVRLLLLVRSDIYDTWLRDHDRLLEWLESQDRELTIELRGERAQGFTWFGRALRAQSRLFQITSLLRKVIQTSPFNRIPSRYSLGSMQHGLLCDLTVLDDILSEASATKWIPRGKVDEFVEIYSRVKNDFSREGENVFVCATAFFSVLGDVLCSGVGKSFLEEEIELQDFKKLEDIFVPIERGIGIDLVWRALQRLTSLGLEDSAKDQYKVAVEITPRHNVAGCESIFIRVLVAAPSCREEIEEKFNETVERDVDLWIDFGCLPPKIELEDNQAILILQFLGVELK